MGLALVLLLAGGIRLWLLLQLPAVSRDGCGFCWYAERLGQQGTAYLREPEARQHPLYPLLILATQRLATAFGAPESPWTWQRCGQAVAFAAGLSVVLLSGVLAGTLSRRLALPLNPQAVRIVAMALAALLPLNAQLSANVMSDQVFLAFFLASVWLMSTDAGDRVPTSLWAGILAGLAFLTRPEGAVLPLAAAGAAVIGWLRGRRRRWAGALAVLIAFSIVASPYWVVVDKFTAKKEVLTKRPSILPADFAVKVATAGSAGPLVLGKLERIDYSPVAVGLVTLYTLFRAGRVVVPLMAVMPLAAFRRRWLDAPLVVVLGVLVLHLGATTWLLWRHDYQDPRHLLPAVALLIPFAAIALAQAYRWARERSQPLLHAVTIVLAFAPLAFYALRPAAPDGYLVDAANRLREIDPHISEKSIMSGSNGQRLAFYADAKWLYWPEDPANDDMLAWQFDTQRPDYFAVETGPRFETEGNAEMLSRLEGNARFGLEEVLRLDGHSGHVLRIFAVRR